MIVSLLPVCQVLPISYFVSHFEVTHTEKMLHFEKECEKMGNTNQVSILSCEGRSYRQKVKKILSSEDRGIILVGSLKVWNPTPNHFISLIVS